MAVSDPALAVETPLRPEDLDDAGALVREAGWNQTADDWRAFLDLGTVYAVRTSAGDVVATAATLPYGNRFAWISMVLVAGAYRRQGLATRLMRRCIDDLEDAGLVPVLDATPAGRAVYRTLAFEDSWSFQRLERHEPQPAGAPPALPAGVELQRIDEALWPAICAYDTQAFGADRSALLARLQGRLPGAAELCAMRNGRVVGFILGRDGRLATELGPLVADDPDIARALFAPALAAISGPVFVDLVDGKRGLRTLLDSYGFRVQRPFTRMMLGCKTPFDDGARTFAVVGPEFG
jgi:GNAT superfamily N-acetyltransferase